MRRSLTCLFSLSSCAAAAVGCYTVTFDETISDAYYCQTDDACGEAQACQQFHCVDDSGPKLAVTGPEPLQNLAFGTTTLTANYSVQDFVITDSSAVTEGQGQIEVSIVGTDISVVSIIEAGAELDISALTPGAYRLRTRALYGDGTPYTNPSASADAVFFIEDQNPLRPQVAFIKPAAESVHIVGEPLEIQVATRNFTLADAGTDCRIDDACDPWGVDADACIPADCEVVPNGHPHVYMLDNYPACLSASPTCNGDYVLSMRTADLVDGIAIATIPGDRFSEPGTFTFSVGLQYNDHLPYPNVEFGIIDQITVTVQER